jgi:hypothetical protein
MQTPRGLFCGVSSFACHNSGELQGINLDRRNKLKTLAGDFIPAYIETERRKNKYSVEFFKSGAVKAVALNEQEEAATPIGRLPAEMLTFFESGELCRLFPSDGKISGFWSEEDERGMQIPLSLDLGFTRFTARISSICFHQSGCIRSSALFPGEAIDVPTKYGAVESRNGVSLYESGELESLEPLRPTGIATPIGVLSAYDPLAIGISADRNSLGFYRNGEVARLIAAGNRIAVQTPDGQVHQCKPRRTPHMTQDGMEQIAGLPVAFKSDGTIEIGRSRFAISKCIFSIGEEDADGQDYACSPSDCMNCLLCR